MALTRVGLAIKTVLSEGCKKLTVEDITGTYNVTSNPLGYGLPNGIIYNDVKTIVINVYYPYITTPIAYTLTLVSGTVTALTVKNLNATVYNIFANLATLYVGGVFNLTGTTAFVLPTITDGVFDVDFTISGVNAATGESFSYTTNNMSLSTCVTECCINNMYKNMDMCCDCNTDKVESAELFLSGAKKAINIGQKDKALCLLTKASDICKENCDNC